MALKDFIAHELRQISMTKSDQNYFIEGLLKDGIEPTLVEMKFIEYSSYRSTD